MRLQNRARALRRAVPLALLAATAVAAGTASTAGADAFGQLGRWGGQGTDPGQFFFSSGFGVDRTDESVYVVDFNAGDDGGSRLQKLSRDGTPLASALVREAGSVLGVAVDPELDRVYLLEHRAAADGEATALRVFSTTPEGGALVAPASVPSGELPVPTGARALVRPVGVAVDPETNDVIVLAETGGDGTRAVVQRISSTGAAGARFVDDAEDPDIVLGGSLPSYTLEALAVGPGGEVYVSTGGGASPRRLYRVAETLDGATELTNAPVSETTQGFQPDTYFGQGPQIAVGDDGTVYWTTLDGDIASGERPANAFVKGWSPATGRVRVVYGGGAASCRIDYHSMALALGQGDDLFVLEHAPSDPFPSPYGERVVEFGPGGTGCPQPQVRFSVDGRTDARIGLGKGRETVLDASGSVLNGADVAEAAWDLDGDGAFETVGTDLRIRHRFRRAGTYAIALRLRLDGAANPEPDPVTRTVEVTPGTPTASFTASSRSPAAGATVTFDASNSIDPTGSPDAGPTNALASYRWEFGDGTTQTTATPTVSHAFANPAADPVARTVRLVVTSRDGASSAPVSQTIAVQGTATQQPPLPDPPRPDPPRPDPPTPPAIEPPSVGVRGVRAVTGGRAVTLSISCPAGATACEGAVAIATTITVRGRRGARGRRGRRARRQSIAIGSASFSIVAGETRTVTVRLNARGRRLLARSRRLKVGIGIATTAGGRTQRQSSTATLTAPRRRAKARRR